MCEDLRCILMYVCLYSAASPLFHTVIGLYSDVKLMLIKYY